MSGLVPVAGGVTVPECPPFLVEAVGGVVLWGELWLSGGEFFDPVADLEIVERYCTNVVLRNECLGMLAGGLSAAGSQGQPVKHPALGMLEMLDKALRADGKELGRSPEARVRLGMTVSKHRTAMDEFEERRQKRAAAVVLEVGSGG